MHWRTAVLRARAPAGEPPRGLSRRMATGLKESHRLCSALARMALFPKQGVLMSDSRITRAEISRTAVEGTGRGPGRRWSGRRGSDDSDSDRLRERA